MNRKDIVSEIAQVQKEILIPYIPDLSLRDILNASAVSKSWHQFFLNPDILKTKLEKDFKIRPEILTKFSASFSAISYLPIIRRLYKLTRSLNSKNQPCFDEREKDKEFYRESHKELVKNAYENTEHQFRLLMCCADQADYMISAVPKEEDMSWFRIALYGECMKVVYEFLKAGRGCLQEAYLHALTTNNLSLLQFLLDPKQCFNFSTPSLWSLNVAATLGYFKIVQFFLDPKNNFKIKPNTSDFVIYISHEPLTVKKTTLSCAAKSGNLELVQFLLDSKNKFKLTIDAADKYEVLRNACESGNVELVKWLLETNKHLRLKFQDALTAITFGRIDLLRFLHAEISTANVWLLTRAAIDSGHLDVVRFFFAEIVEFKSAEKMDLPIKKIFLLHQAASKKYLQSHAIFAFLLNVFEFKSTFSLSEQSKLLTECLKLAYKNENANLICFLLDQRNHFVFVGDPLAYHQDFMESKLIYQNKWYWPVITFLLDPKNNFNINFTQKDITLFLRCALVFDDLAVAYFLLKHKKLIPNKDLLEDILDLAAARGNYQFLRHLLDSKNEFQLKPTQETLRHAISSDNFEVVRYLLAPKNGFGLVADEFALIDYRLRVFKRKSPTLEPLLQSAHLLESLKKSQQINANECMKSLNIAFNKTPGYFYEVIEHDLDAIKFKLSNNVKVFSEFLKLLVNSPYPKTQSLIAEESLKRTIKLDPAETLNLLLQAKKSFAEKGDVLSVQHLSDVIEKFSCHLATSTFLCYRIKR